MINHRTKVYQTTSNLFSIVDTIEDNVENAAAHVESGRDEIVKAAEYQVRRKLSYIHAYVAVHLQWNWGVLLQRKARKKKLCILLILFIILAILVLVIVLSVKLK